MFAGPPPLSDLTLNVDAYNITLQLKSIYTWILHTYIGLPEIHIRYKMHKT